MTVCGGLPSLEVMIFTLVLSVLIPSIIIYILYKMWKPNHKWVFGLVSVIVFIILFFLISITIGFFVPSPSCGGTGPLKNMPEKSVLSKLEETNKKLAFAETQIIVEKEQKKQVIFGLKNTQDIPLNFFIEIEIKNQKKVVDNSALEMVSLPLYTLNPQEIKAYLFIIKAKNEATTYLVTLKVIDIETSEVYEQGSFFVTVVE